ncbi:uncharacterized protein PITG_23322 [Phytophthora infestans T30-4]|uniref:DUF7869 domain-containing protein n=1 Tax=Phytophthora infestans (strain T30-4) TaxID=403677 RepID=D0NH32_PHYIT|nr:uncharacterized protein PITG_23322 [Phytophthora infestans T30-4]EEY58671.1 hypothetical protein PITG_23322 [Phytophthora infestans T30-4]|eukprot:XP_002901615.1 hypothetical protein PITG_23322 [Phytophthora infestans T30-4]
MLDPFIGKLADSGKKRLTVYADNCSGQNKNNFVTKFFLAQVHMGRLQHVNYKFFVKGHTKNSCDRGFGHIRKHVAGIDIRTMDHLVDAVGAAASNAATVYVPAGEKFLKEFQLFSMDNDKPWVVSCRKSPESEVDERDLRRKFDGILTPKEKVIRILIDHIEYLPPPVPNAEKIAQLYQSIRPYVPAEFSDVPLYAKPTAQQGDVAKANKQARRLHRAAMVIAAKKHEDQRGRGEVEDHPEPSPENPTPATTTNKTKGKAGPVLSNRGAKSRKTAEG